MTRTETTKFLGKLLTDTRLGGAGSHWASEVSIDPWTPKARRLERNPEERHQAHVTGDGLHLLDRPCS